jgi:hypothetical protein
VSAKKIAIIAYDQRSETVPCKAKVCRGGAGLGTLRAWLDDARVPILQGAPTSGRARYGRELRCRDAGRLM